MSNLSESVDGSSQLISSLDENSRKILLNEIKLLNETVELFEKQRQMKEYEKTEMLKEDIMIQVKLFQLKLAKSHCKLSNISILNSV